MLKDRVDVSGCVKMSHLLMKVKHSCMEARSWIYFSFYTFGVKRKSHFVSKGTGRFVFCAGQHLESEEGDDVLFYILLRAVDRFYEKYSRFPGVDNDNVEPDIPLLKVGQLFDYLFPQSDVIFGSYEEYLFFCFCKLKARQNSDLMKL